MILNKCFIFIILILILILVFICNQKKYFGGLVKKIIVKKKITVATTTPINIFKDTPLSKDIILFIEIKEIDTYILNKNDLILFKNQLNYEENGIYKVLDIIDNKIIIEKQNNNNIKNTVYLVQNGLQNKDKQWNIYYDIYIKYYHTNHYLFKLSNITNKTYEKQHIIKTKYWIDTTNNKNIAKPLIGNFLNYNNIKNHIFSFNGIIINLNKNNTVSTKSIFIVTHILSPNIYLINTEVSFLKMNEFNKTCFIDGINKIVINNILFIPTNNSFNEDQRKEIFNLIYNKPCIIYIEFLYTLNIISLNKPLEINNKITSFIYEIKLYSNNINNINDYIKSINNKLNIFFNTHTSNTHDVNTESNNLIAYFDGNRIETKIKKSIIFAENNIEVDFIQKQLLMNNKIIHIHLLSTKNIVLTKYNDFVFKTQATHIDGTILQNNFMIMLKNQTNYEENGIYKYINDYLYKQDFDKNLITNTTFYITQGTQNSKNNWIININNSLSQKNISYNKILNPIHQINQKNPYINLINKNQKCIIDSEIYDQNTSCNKWPCDLRSKLGCLLFSGRFPINIHIQSNMNVILHNNLSLSDLSDQTCQKIFSDYRSYFQTISDSIDTNTLDFNINNHINTNIYKADITSLDDIKIQNQKLILLNHQKNPSENGIYKVICINKIHHIQLYKQLLTNFKSLIKKIESDKSIIYQKLDIENLFPLKTNFDYYIYKKINNLSLPIITDNNITQKLSIDKKTKINEEIWNIIVNDQNKKEIITSYKVLYFLKQIMHKLIFEIKILYKKSYVLLEYIDLIKTKNIIEHIQPTLQFPSYTQIVLYINSGSNENKFYKIQLQNTNPSGNINTYKFTHILDKTLFKGGLSDWTRKNYPYIPYKIYKDTVCQRLLREQAKETVDDLDLIDYEGASFGEKSLDILYDFLLAHTPDGDDAEYIADTIARFNTPLGLSYVFPLTLTCKSQRVFDEFFHYKRGRFWHYFDNAFDEFIDLAHAN